MSQKGPQTPIQNSVTVNGCYYFNEYGYKAPVGFDTREMQMKEAGIDTDVCHAFGKGFYPCSEDGKPSWPQSINVYGPFKAGAGEMYFDIDPKLFEGYGVKGITLTNNGMPYDMDADTTTGHVVGELKPHMDPTGTITIDLIPEGGEKPEIHEIDAVLIPEEWPGMVEVYYTSLEAGATLSVTVEGDIPSGYNKAECYSLDKETGIETKISGNMTRGEKNLFTGTLSSTQDALKGGHVLFINKKDNKTMDIDAGYAEYSDKATEANVKADTLNAGDTVTLELNGELSEGDEITETKTDDGTTTIVDDWTKSGDNTYTGTLQTDVEANDAVKTIVNKADDGGGGKKAGLTEELPGIIMYEPKGQPASKADMKCGSTSHGSEVTLELDGDIPEDEVIDQTKTADGETTIVSTWTRTGSTKYVGRLETDVTDNEQIETTLEKKFGGAKAGSEPEALPGIVTYDLNGR